MYNTAAKDSSLSGGIYTTRVCMSTGSRIPNTSGLLQIWSDNTRHMVSCLCVGESYAVKLNNFLSHYVCDLNYYWGEGGGLLEFHRKPLCVSQHEFICTSYMCGFPSIALSRTSFSIVRYNTQHSYPGYLNIRNILHAYVTEQFWRACMHIPITRFCASGIATTELRIAAKLFS